jgi:hypothetical protein
MTSVRIANLAVITAIICSVGCASLGAFNPPSLTTCSKIAYYDSYVESAQRAVILCQFIPGVGPFLGAASQALLLLDAALDHATHICNLAASGAASEQQTKAALDAVYDTIVKFNSAYGQLKTAAKGVQ